MSSHRHILLTYAISFSIFALVSWMTGAWEQNPVGALLFQAILFWALNEFWYWISAWLGLVPALVLWWKSRNSKENSDSRERAMHTEARRTRAAALVLLLAPHALFGGLMLVDAIAQGALQRWMDLNLGASLFLPSFAACCVLFVVALSGRARPYSLFAFLDEQLDPSLGEEKITPAVEPAPLPPSSSEVGPNGDPLSRRHSREYGKHERRVAAMMEPGEIILEETAPVPYAFNRSTRIDLYLSLPFLLGSLWAFSMAVKLVNQSSGALVAGGVFAMAAVFLLAGLMLVTSPLRWKKKLAHIDYFLTSKRVILAEGDALRQFRWNGRLHISFASEDGENGSIYLSEETRLTAALGKLLGKGAVNNRETDATGRMNGLLNIPQAQRVYVLILSLIDKEGGTAI